MMGALIAIMTDESDARVSAAAAEARAEVAAESERATRASYVRDVMETLGMDVDRAMDVLRVPEVERTECATLVVASR
jgi:hypothetical protein